jgi:hypothetical protein
MEYRLNNHVGRYVIYLTFDTDGQLSTRLYDKGDDINSANMYSPIVSYDGFVYGCIDGKYRLCVARHETDGKTR